VCAGDVVQSDDQLAAVEKLMKRICIDAYKSCDEAFLQQAIASYVNACFVLAVSR
jgi:hypothetical protein